MERIENSVDRTAVSFRISTTARSAPPLPAANNRRHVSSNDRDIPCRRAVDEIARGACMLSSTIFSFSSSVQ